MYCKNCGAPLMDGALFCAQCGTKVPAEQPGAFSAPQPTAPVPPAAQPRSPFEPAQRTADRVFPSQQRAAAHPTYPAQQSLGAPPFPPQTCRCPNCGRALRPGVAFCAGCGAPVGGPQFPQQNPGAPYPQQRTALQQGYTPYPQSRTPPPGSPYPSQQGQASYGQWQPQPYMQTQPPVKKKRAVPFIALLLAAAILVTGFVTPGFFVKEKRAEALINRVQVHIPNPTGPEAIVRLTGDVALQYYIEARLYLEKLSQYNEKHLDEKEFAELVLNTLAALENAEKMCDCLSEAVDLWMECDDVREEPTYKVLHEAKDTAAFSDLFAVKAYAAEPSPSEIRAKDIIDAFDKGKNGQKIQAVADLLGTDAKHAYVQLKMALAGEEKATYDKIADQATTCIKVAKTLKTAGTVAGLVIAAAPVATGAVATMAAGEMLATGTGVVVAAVNTGLEVTSTGAMLYHGTDENEVTQIADAISDSKFMQTVNLVTSVAGLGYNVKNAINEIEKLANSGGGVKELGQFLNKLSDGKTASDVYGMLSFGLGNLDTLPGMDGALMREGTKSLVTMITHTGEGGLTIDIADTVIGTGKNQIEAVNRLLDEFGITDTDARGVLDTAVGLYRGETSESRIPTDPADTVPSALVDALLSERIFISPDGGKADIDKTISTVESFLKELSESERVPESKADTTPTPAPDGKPTSEPTPKPTSEPTPKPTAAPKGFAGRYSGTLVVPGQIEAYGAVVQMTATPVYVTINDDNSAVFQTNVDSVYSYSGFGATMNGSSTATVRQENISGERSGDEIRYSFKTRATSTTTTSYSGPMYAGGGGNATTTSESDYEVRFTASLQPDGSVIIKGEMLITPAEATAGSIDTTITFACTRK